MVAAAATQAQAAAKLDLISDAVDDVNVLKLKNGHAFDKASEFDVSKEKDNFRQYEDACDRVKGFYAVSAAPTPHGASLLLEDCLVLTSSYILRIQEQHAKQTLEYNLKIRAEFNKTVRARLSVWQAMEVRLVV
jgi:inositol oxygenase